MTLVATTFGKRKTPPPTDASAPVFFPVAPEPIAPVKAPEIVEFAPLPDGRPCEIGVYGAQGRYVLLLERSVTVQNVDELHFRILELTGRGERSLTLVINSPGGHVVPTLQLYERVKYLPIRIHTHGRGAVQSAANFLMLIGARRTASADTTFLFHPAAREISGRLNREDFAKEVQRMENLEKALSRVYFERTTLPHAAVARFHRETVVYDVATARRFDIIHAIEDIELPSEVLVAPSPTESLVASSR